MSKPLTRYEVPAMIDMVQHISIEKIKIEYRK